VTLALGGAAGVAAAALVLFGYLAWRARPAERRLSSRRADRRGEDAGGDRARRLRETMTRGLTALLVTFVAAAATLLPATAATALAARDGAIAYPSQRGLWALDPTTHGQRQLTSDPSDSYPAFSPSGELLAFQRGRRASDTIYLARADGSEARPLTWGAQPSFSPDGRRIVFVRPAGLFVIALAPGARARAILRQPGARTPDWGASGLIAFERTDVWKVGGRGQAFTEWQAEIDTIRPPSSRVTRLLTDSGDVNMWPRWSPDGHTVAVSLCNEVGPMAAQAARAQAVSLLALSACVPTVWAPSGRRMLEAGSGMLGGRDGTSCPSTRDVRPGPVSWQPLGRATMLVPTAPCVPVHEASHTITAEPQKTEGTPPGPGTKICFFNRHHRRRCVRV
jgi:WD40 repeat protein